MKVVHNECKSIIEEAMISEIVETLEAKQKNGLDNIALNKKSKQ